MSARDRSHRTRVWRTAVPARSGFRWIGLQSTGASQWRSARGAVLSTNGTVVGTTRSTYGRWTAADTNGSAPVITPTGTNATTPSRTPEPRHGWTPTGNAGGRYPGIHGVGDDCSTPMAPADRTSGTPRLGMLARRTPTCGRSRSGNFAGFSTARDAGASIAIRRNPRASTISSPCLGAVGMPSATWCGRARVAIRPRGLGFLWSTATVAATGASPQPESAGLLSGEAAGCGAWPSPRTTQEVGQW